VRPKPYHRNRFGSRIVRAFVWVVLIIFVLTSVGAILIVTVH
jgi:small-conductance mechanosensitive channel